jgi:anti-sigma B factor antagonist
VHKVAHPPDEFVCDVRANGEGVVVRLAGELDLEVAGDVAAAVEELLDAGFPEVVVDLREVSFLDSSGVHMLVAARRSAERRRRAVSLIPGPRNVQRVLELTGMEALFTFVAAEGDG